MLRTPSGRKVRFSLDYTAEDATQSKFRPGAHCSVDPGFLQ
jgi:hypothetical protein